MDETVSVDRNCGEQITWLRRADDSGWMPPLDLIGHVYVEEEGRAVQKIGYQVHRCDPGKMEAWMDYLERKGQITGDTSEVETVVVRRLAKEREAESARSIAEQVECDSCHAVVGKPCLNLGDLKKHKETPTTWPHPIRLEKAYAAADQREAEQVPYPVVRSELVRGNEGQDIQG